MTPVVASPWGEGIPSSPLVVCSHLIFHRAQVAGSIHGDQQMQGENPQNGFLPSCPCGLSDCKPFDSANNIQHTMLYHVCFLEKCLTDKQMQVGVNERRGRNSKHLSVRIGVGVYGCVQKSSIAYSLGGNCFFL